MPESIEVCSHIYQLVEDMCERCESVQNIACVSCSKLVAVDNKMPARVLLSYLRVVTPLSVN